MYLEKEKLEPINWIACRALSVGGWGVGGNNSYVNGGIGAVRVLGWLTWLVVAFRFWSI